MRKLLLLFFISSFIFGCGPLQNANYSKAGDRVDNPKNKYRNKYDDKLDPGSTMLKSFYHYSVEKSADNKYIYKQYFPTTRQLIIKRTYQTINMNTLDGLSQDYTDDGILYGEGNYVNGKMEGMWKRFDIDNGILSSKSEYKNGSEHGTYQSFDPEGNVIAQYEYKNGKKDGPYQIFRGENYQLSEQGVYTNGEQTKKEVLIEDEEQVFTIVDEMPRFPGCENLSDDERKSCADRKMLEHIYRNIKYPAIAREMGIEGMCIASFVIDKDGSVTELKVWRSYCQEMRDECTRVIETMPKWIPGKRNGEAVKVQFNLPIKFKLV